MPRLGFWEAPKAALKRGEGVVLYHVVEHSKGSPGTNRAKMWVFEDGSQVGTIGGGVMEARLIASALERLKREAPEGPRLIVQEHRRGGDVGKASGLICGGAQTLLAIDLKGGDDLVLIERVAEAAAEEQELAIEVTENGVRLLSFAVKDWLEQPDGKRLLVREGGSWKVRLKLWSDRRIAIFGGGHCGVALANLMVKLDFSVVVVEPRSDLFTLGELSPEVVLDGCSYATGVEHLRFREMTEAVVMTHSMLTDVEALAAVFAAGMPKVGVMGSTAKRVEIHRQLLIKGFSEAEIGAVMEPLGLNFDSNTPEEIAVSVAARILLG
ncbi:MAG: XdhC family protein [Puniceicoccaceae bacterium]